MGIEGIDNLTSTETVHDVGPTEETAETEARRESELEAERRKHMEERNSGMAERERLRRETEATHPQTAGPVTS